MSSKPSEHDEIIAEAREKYTVHNCRQCEFRKSCNNEFDSDECKDMRRSIMLGFGIEDGYFTKLLDRLEAAHKRELGATCEKSSQVGNAAKIREALERCVKMLDICLLYSHEGYLSQNDDIRDVMAQAENALAAPPRNCDVMSLEIARKVWFAKEMVPRLFGDLPLGREVPFEEWFVSQQEQGGAK